jgi:hypothetical protein
MLVAQHTGVNPAGPRCAATVQFAGQLWDVHTGDGPLDAVFDRCNVRLDQTGSRLTLRITCQGGRCSSAEVASRQKYLFGTFQVQAIGRIDRLTPSVIFGIFTYPGDSLDGTREIDIEYARYGDAAGLLANYVVYPDTSIRGYRNAARSFGAALADRLTTHRISWGRTSILFQSLNGHTDSDLGEAACWSYSVPESDVRRVPHAAVPLLLNIYPHDAAKLPDGSYEMIISSVSYARAERPPTKDSACN